LFQNAIHISSKKKRVPGLANVSASGWRGRGVLLYILLLITVCINNMLGRRSAGIFIN
jgi:hypothetical protein